MKHSLYQGWPKTEHNEHIYICLRAQWVFAKPLIFLHLAVWFDYFVHPEIYSFQTELATLVHIRYNQFDFYPTQFDV